MTLVGGDIRGDQITLVADTKVTEGNDERATATRRQTTDQRADGVQSTVPARNQ
jgi:hypothetical protein